MSSFGLVPMIKSHYTIGMGRKLTWAYNAAEVMRKVATGGGCSSLVEVLATVGAPILSKQMFTKIEQCFDTSFELLLLELISGQNEKQIAE